MPEDDAKLIVRCAIYTRKSTEEGLDQDLNSLEAQRDTCSAYIKSQRHKGWTELAARYDDGGWSGANLGRPALQRLLSDIEAARVDVVVIYKIDRLSRSLVDFVRLVDLFERFGVSFVSITQAFDTSDTMGRLIQNILLTFAQFEREMTADRLRDKFATMKRHGKWVGGRAPFGYDKIDKKLVIYEPEAIIIRYIFDQYPLETSGTQLLRKLQAQGIRNKVRMTRKGKPEGGHLMGPGILHRILTNPIYLGKVDYRGEWHEGEHEAIITMEQWNRVQAIRAKRIECGPRKPTGSLFLGILHDAHGRRMSADLVRRADKDYCYYATELTREGRRQKLKILRANADDVEQLALAAIRSFLCDRPALTDALLSLGLYNGEVRRALGAGPKISARIAKLDKVALRHVYQALLARAELDREKLRLIIRCAELARLLAWDGVGVFKLGAQVAAIQGSRIYVLDAPATIVREDGIVRLPIAPAEPDGHTSINPRLVGLLEDARAAQAEVYTQRHKSLREIAQARGCGPTHLARLIKLNYLAPDIVAAIIDGRSPSGLTRKTLLRATLPLDWAQQRMLLGFPPMAGSGYTTSPTARNHAPREGGLVML